MSLEPEWMYGGAASSQSSASLAERDRHSELPRYPIGLYHAQPHLRGIIGAPGVLPFDHHDVERLA